MGVRSLQADDAVAHDTLFRITSMCRPITAAALMILVDECVLRLDDPIDRWLPELANRTVLKHGDSMDAAALTNVKPATRPITVRDVLTLRTGYGMSLAPTAIQKAIAAFLRARIFEPRHAQHDVQRNAGPARSIDGYILFQL
jgi:CubicO group peptidase (beta-lactamase class C family)